jgi:hypothetical protein
VARTRVCVALGCCLLALPALAPAQSRKPGLWTMTTTVNNATSSTGTAAHPTTYSGTVCLTQALIDKYGAPPPHISDDCHITRLDKKANSVSAEMVCSGAVVGKATMQSSWTAEQATGSVHFVGTAPKPMEWTSNSTSVFKSADCGSVQPLPMPTN